MKQILSIVLLVLCGIAVTNPVAAQIPLERPDVEYPNDLRELGTLRRVFVYSTPDLLSRQVILKELKRESGLLDVVERPEDADYFLLFYGAAGQGAESLIATATAGQATTTGILIAWRRVKTCEGFRQRILFITSKSKTVHSGIALPLTLLNQGAVSPLTQGGLGARPLSKKSLIAEGGVRLVLFLLGKKFRRALSFDQLNNTLTLSFSAEAEVQAAREFLRQVKKARAEQPAFYAGPMLPVDGFNSSATDAAPRARMLSELTDEPVPCPPESLRRTDANYGEVDLAGDNLGSEAFTAPSPTVRPRRVSGKGLSAPSQ